MNCKMKEISADKRYVPVVVERYYGEDYLAFMLEIGEKGEVNVVDTEDCSLADTDGDYIFDSEYDLIRIQSDRDYSSRNDNWSKYLQYLYVWAVEHSDPVFSGCSPACYDEWLDNENEEELE